MEDFSLSNLSADNIQMVDLKGQYLKIQQEIDSAVLGVIKNAKFINGPEVKLFAQNLSTYLGVTYVLPCANGTDALQIALMSLNLDPGDEIIVPSFTYVATVEVICLLKLKPVMVDVDPLTFNLSITEVAKAITSKTRAIVPVHLFGQCADMEPLLEIGVKHKLFIIEDTAQAIGATYTFKNGEKRKAGTIGNIGCTSFFPSKNLGCFGDGGAIFTDNKSLAERVKMISNHGQIKKYIHKVVGVNSRLDTIQAAVLNVKLKYLDIFSKKREMAADIYDDLLGACDQIKIPHRATNSIHVFHQYTIIVKNRKRDALKKHLGKNNIPTMIYYPQTVDQQEAFKLIGFSFGDMNVAKDLCHSVLSLPMHTELTKEEQVFIVNKINAFFDK